MELKENDEAAIINKYKETMRQLLSHSFKNLTPVQIEQSMDYSIKKRLINPKVKLENLYKKKILNTNVIDICDYIIKREPICTSYGVLFKKHADAPNPLIDVITKFLTKRKEYKKKMFTFPKGSEEFEKYNLLQLLKKIDTNSLYGALGNSACILFNLHVAGSITTQARSCTSAAGDMFESFLANNIKFSSLNECVTFINNIVNEKPERKYNDDNFLDENISVEKCFSKIVLSCGFEFIPDEEDCLLIWNLLNSIHDEPGGVENINRIYYKNNLYEFMSNNSMQKAVLYILKKLDAPFLNPNECPEIIQTEMDEFTSILEEYVYYHHQIIDRIDKYNYSIRSVSIITDTDSSMISLDAWYRYVLDLTKGIDMEIKHDKMKIMVEPRLEKDEFGDFPHKLQIVKHREDDPDYSFYDDEIIEQKKAVNILEVIPQEGLRYSIVNIMSYVITYLANDYMKRYTMNTHSYREGVKCLIDEKNEFLFKTIYLLYVKKSYADIQELQEGNVIQGGMMDIKGLPMMKSTTNKRTFEALSKILYNDILNAGTIDQVKIIKHLAIFRKEIINSIMKGESDFFKPLKIKAYRFYEEPMSTSGIKQAIIWNKVKDEDLPGFDLEDDNYMNIVKVIITPKNVDQIKDKYPETYDKIISVLNDKDFKGKIDSIALPKDTRTPNWLLEFIDYNSIINDNLSLFPLEPIGIYTGHKKNNYTNIMSI